MKKGSLRNILLVLFTFILGGGLFVYLLSREGLDTVFEGLAQFGFLPFLGFVGLSLLNFCFYTLRWNLLLAATLPGKKRVPFTGMFLDRMAGYAVSYLTPVAQVGGEPARIAMLVARGVPGKAATSATALDITFELLFYMGFILAGSLLAFSGGVVAGVSLTAIMVVMSVFFLAILSFLFWLSRTEIKLPKLKRASALKDWLLETHQLMAMVVQGGVVRLIVISALSFLAISFRVIEVLYIAFFFGISITFSQAFLVATLPGIALLLPVPAGVGVFEGGFSLLFTALGIPLSAVGFAFIIRMRDALFMVGGITHMLATGGTALVKRLR